jgi:hypothetical protein
VNSELQFVLVQHECSWIRFSSFTGPPIFSVDSVELWGSPLNSGEFVWICFWAVEQVHQFLMNFCPMNSKEFRRSSADTVEVHRSPPGARILWINFRDRDRVMVKVYMSSQTQVNPNPNPVNLGNPNSNTTNSSELKFGGVHLSSVKFRGDNHKFRKAVRLVVRRKVL